jgi:hypothetical protein
MAQITVVDATLDHAQAIAQDARPADVAELWAQARSTPLESMARGIERSVFALTALFDGVPVAMFGVVLASALTGRGTPWMIATRQLDRHQRQFLRACLPAVAEMSRMFPVLVNEVDARNTKAIRWLAWLGFTIHPARPAGPDGLPFHPFEKRAHV